MGLDSIQIVVETEQCFNIQISNREAEQIRTVDDLVECVWRKVKQSDSNTCLNQIIFFRLRKFFCSEFNLKPAEFRLETKLRELAEKNYLKNSWKKIESELNLNTPFLSTGFISFKRNNIWTKETVADLTLKVLKENMGILTKEDGLKRNTVHSVIAIITHEIVGIPLKDIVSSSKFVDDLGVS